MLKSRFHTGWMFSRQGEEEQAVPVTLPHDAMIRGKRSRTASTGGAGGYFPGGTYVYVKRFSAPAEWREKQKRYLESYAELHGYTNIVHYTDDGWSGGNFDRPDWKRLIRDIEAGLVGTVLVKDMSRVGRNYLQTGFYTEIFSGSTASILSPSPTTWITRIRAAASSPPSSIS